MWWAEARDARCPKTQDTKELSQIPCGFGIALFRIKEGLELNCFA